MSRNACENRRNGNDFHSGHRKQNSELSLSLSFNYTQDLNLFLLIYNQKILSKNPLPCIIKPLS